MERTVLIANTSNMPVSAREASIYTGITIAEYFRDMGYNVALMADSTSRWAEALREISGRLEEMPAEEGFPPYLASRLAEFYERAGRVVPLGFEDKYGSISVIGSVSPPGGDFSEPVTKHTKRFTRCFWALDKSLANERHYPSVNWLNSYSEYLDDLEDWYNNNINEDFMKLRKSTLALLNEDDRLQQIIKLVGEDVLPDDQKLIVRVARIIKTGYLQQNAFSENDAFCSMKRQFKMLNIINTFYQKAKGAIEENIAVSEILDKTLVNKLMRMKEDISDDKLEAFDKLEKDIDSFFKKLHERYEKE
jgi:V/A-type H+-transporting ATPase subunit A